MSLHVVSVGLAATIYDAIKKKTSLTAAFATNTNVVSTNEYPEVFDGPGTESLNRSNLEKTQLHDEYLKTQKRTGGIDLIDSSTASSKTKISFPGESIISSDEFAKHNLSQPLLPSLQVKDQAQLLKSSAETLSQSIQGPKLKSRHSRNAPEPEASSLSESKKPNEKVIKDPKDLVDADAFKIAGLEKQRNSQTQYYSAKLTAPQNTSSPLDLLHLASMKVDSVKMPEFKCEERGE